MFVTVGSSADLVTGDPEDRAAINVYNPDGGGHEVYATGLRNTVGLRFYPGTDHLWGTVEERNELGDGLVADYFHQHPEGRLLWLALRAYSGKNPDPR